MFGVEEHLIEYSCEGCFFLEFVQKLDFFIYILSLICLKDVLYVEWLMKTSGCNLNNFSMPFCSREYLLAIYLIYFSI